MAQRQTPEERELARKHTELATLEAELVQRELDLATLQAALRAFEARYLRIVGTRYALLDDLEAQISEEFAHRRPQDGDARAQAAEARARAEESAGATAGQAQSQPFEFKPSANLKMLYREIAKALHPDLATNDDQRTRRTRLMAEANRAYEAGDEARLRAILDEWETSPESVKGEGLGADLVRTIRKIAQVEVRLRVIETESAHLEASDLYQLRVKVDDAARIGHDLLAEMAAQVDLRIDGAKRRLEDLRRLK